MLQSSCCWLLLAAPVTHAAPQPHRAAAAPPVAGPQVNYLDKPAQFTAEQLMAMLLVDLKVGCLPACLPACHLTPPLLLHWGLGAAGS